MKREKKLKRVYSYSATEGQKKYIEKKAKKFFEGNISRLIIKAVESYEE